MAIDTTHLDADADKIKPARPALLAMAQRINDWGVIGVVRDSITALKALDKTKNTRALITGYFTAGDGGGGDYWYDSTDTTSADNGGTIIVATDGGRWKLIFSGNINVRWFGAKGDGSTDDTLAIQKGLDYCWTVQKALFFPAGEYCVKEASVGATYALLNRGVSMLGEGTFYSKIKALSSMSAGVDFIRVTPFASAYVDFLEIGRLAIEPTNGSTKGRHGIYILTPDSTNFSRLHIHDVCVFAGNDYSLHIENNMTNSPQGVPSNTVIERNSFMEGTRMTGIGDSVSIRNNIFRSSGGGRCGVYLYLTDQAGVASHCVISENNFDCVGGALQAIRGRSIKFINNNVELSAGAGTPNGAVVDIDGSSGSIPWAEVCSNHVGIFGTATATSAIRINGAAGTVVDKNTLLAGITVSNAIAITASATDTVIGFNEISSGYTTAVSNGGVKTIGTDIAVAPLNGFANAVGYRQLSAFKNQNGIINLSGVVTAPASPNGVIVCQLPSGYRPSALIRTSVGATVGGVVSPQAVEVNPSGNIVFYGSNSTTSVEICINFPTTNYISGAL